MKQVPEYQTKRVPDYQVEYQPTPAPVYHTTPAPEYHTNRDYHTVKVTTFAPDERYLQKIKASTAHNYIPLKHPDDRRSSSLSETLSKLQQSNHLPPTLTTDNVDNSIKTLVKILNNIKQSEVAQKPPPEYASNQADDYYDYGNDDDGI